MKKEKKQQPFYVMKGRLIASFHYSEEKNHQNKFKGPST